LRELLLLLRELLLLLRELLLLLRELLLRTGAGRDQKRNPQDAASQRDGTFHDPPSHSFFNGLDNKSLTA
jgi:hypothetical protein